MVLTPDLRVQDYDFELDNGNQFAKNESRKRNLGLTNRVIAGLLLHQVRVLGRHLCLMLCTSA